MIPGTYKTTFLGVEYPLYYVTEKCEAEKFISRLMGQEGLFAIDTETAALSTYKDLDGAALSPHLSRVRLLQLFTGRSVLVFDTGKIGDDRIFKAFLETKRFVGQNSVFDLGFFYRQFGISKMNIGCTYLIAKLLFHAIKPTDDGTSASLENLVKAFLGTELHKEMHVSDFSVPELTFEQVEYAGLDTVATYFLAEKLAVQLMRFGLDRIYKLYKDAQHPIVKMQLNGIGFNVDRHRDMIVGWRSDLYKAKQELIKLTSLDFITAATIGGYMEKTLPKNILEVWPRTEMGKLATDSHVFADFDFVDIVKPFAEFQKKEKLCTAFGNRLIEQINPETKRLHPSYKLAGARTGRLSCVGPNLQQSPRDKDFRQNFVPAPGKVFIVADYSAVEVRAIAETSEDSKMLSIFEKGEDIYKATASLVLKKPIESITKEERQIGKVLVLGLNYGLGKTKLTHYARKGYKVHIDQEQASQYVNDYRAAYPRLREWQKEQVDYAAERNFVVVSPMGKRRKLDPENAFGTAINFPIQAGCSEVMLKSLMLLNEACSSDIKLIGSIHDEVILETDPNTAMEAESILEECMLEGYLSVYPSGRTTKGLVEAHEGSNWAEAKK